MASQGYLDWVRAGRPYELIAPAAALQGILQGHGLTVWDFPDESHQKASTPEDHTPYSVTGFPGSNARWKARGLDIMPRASTAAAWTELAEISRQIIRDRDAGVPGVMWIKYINWTDENGTCRQERWMTRGLPLQRETRSSSDKGHTHVSGRSDADNDQRANGYDPITRMRGSTMELSDKVAQPAWDTAPAGWKADAPGADLDLRSIFGGLHRRVYLIFRGVTAVWEKLGAIEQKLGVGEPTNSGSTVTLTDEQLQTLTNGVAAALGGEITKLRLENRELRQRLAQAYGPGSE